MLKILPIQTKEEQKKLCDLCSVTYRPECLAYSAYDDENFVGIAQFKFSDKKVFLTDIKNADGVEDEEALFIMGRGLLNYTDLVGIHDAFLESYEKISPSLAMRIGFFPDENGMYYMNLRGFFDAKH